MKTISSRHNPLFKRVREAIREHEDEIAIEGPKHVADALRAGWQPLLIAHRAGSAAVDGSANVAPITGRNAQEIAFEPELFDDLSATETPQGILGLFARPVATFAALVARRETIVVALDRVQDPGNVGTIIRLAAAFDAAGVALLPGCADPFSPKAIRASAGAILSTAVAMVAPLELLTCGLPLYAADARGQQVHTPVSAGILIFGSEGSGVSPELLDGATLVAIATSGRIESLNVASSAAILLAESFARRGKTS
jgi:TrmH family RNA methyltransferase